MADYPQRVHPPIYHMPGQQVKLPLQLSPKAAYGYAPGYPMQMDRMQDVVRAPQAGCMHAACALLRPMHLIIPAIRALRAQPQQHLRAAPTTTTTDILQGPLGCWPHC